MSKFVPVIAIATLGLALAGCAQLSSLLNNPTTVSNSVTDALTAVNDVQAVIKAVQAGGVSGLTPAQLTQLGADADKLSTDAGAMQTAAGGSATGGVATVLSDIGDVVKLLAPFVPTIVQIAALAEAGPSHADANTVALAGVAAHSIVKLKMDVAAK